LANDVRVPGSGVICVACLGVHLLADGPSVLDKVCPVELARADRNSNATAKWAKIISLFNALRQARLEGKGSHEPVLAFANMFIDDFPMMLGVQGVGRAVLVTFASLLAALGVLPQGKKVLPEGDFQHF
jgi:hypothetical protein